MGVQVIARRLSQRLLVANTDEVLLGAQIPQGGMLYACHFEIHTIYAVMILFGATMFSQSAYVVPVGDVVDTATSFDTLWDNRVPKAVGMGVGALDIDDDTLAAEPDFEFGSVDPNAIFNTQGGIVEIFSRRGLLTLANTPGKNIDDTDFIPTDFFKETFRKRVRVDSPSVVMLGVGQMDGVNTTAVAEQTVAASDWSLLRFVGEALDYAWIQLMGTVETGAETPFEDLATIIGNWIEPLIREETAGSFLSPSMNVYAKATFEMVVPGDFDNQSLTSQ